MTFGLFLPEEAKRGPVPRKANAGPALPLPPSEPPPVPKKRGRKPGTKVKAQAAASVLLLPIMPSPLAQPIFTLPPAIPNKARAMRNCHHHPIFTGLRWIFWILTALPIQATRSLPRRPILTELSPPLGCFTMVICNPKSGLAH